MSYIVQVTNKAQQGFFSITDALQYAKSNVYASLPMLKKAYDMLQHGEAVSWDYGFNSVTIKSGV